MPHMKKLTAKEILKINDWIWTMSKKSGEIEYGGHNEYTTNTSQIKHLVKHAPNKESIDIATYYLKNLILLQAFADANHRTAFESVRYFFRKNDIGFRCDPVSIYEIQTEIYSLRFKIYGTYEEMYVSILTEPKNELYYYLKNYIEHCLR